LGSTVREALRAHSAAQSYWSCSRRRPGRAARSPGRCGWAGGGGIQQGLEGVGGDEEDGQQAQAPATRCACPACPGGTSRWPGSCHRPTGAIVAYMAKWTPNWWESARGEWSSLSDPLASPSEVPCPPSNLSRGWSSSCSSAP
jgi:hypothetical protein